MIMNAFMALKKIDYKDETLRFDFELPYGLPVNTQSVIYNERTTPKTFFYSTTEGKTTHLEDTPENFAKWVQPFIDLWQAEKDRLEQEQIEAEQELLKFENRKERALETLVNDYHGALEGGFVRSSMGFDADISPDSVATLSGTNIALNRNILAEEAPKTIFRDFYGLKRELDKVQVELLICQINAAQNHIRELKYTFKDKIKNTIDNESLNAALGTCVYSTLDFSKLSEDGKPTVMPFEQVSTYVDRIDTRYR